MIFHRRLHLNPIDLAIRNYNGVPQDPHHQWLRKILDFFTEIQAMEGQPAIGEVLVTSCEKIKACCWMISAPQHQRHGSRAIGKTGG